MRTRRPRRGATAGCFGFSPLWFFCLACIPTGRLLAIRLNVCASALFAAGAGCVWIARFRGLRRHLCRALGTDVSIVFIVTTATTFRIQSRGRRKTDHRAVSAVAGPAAAAGRGAGRSCLGSGRLDPRHIRVAWYPDLKGVQRHGKQGVVAHKPRQIDSSAFAERLNRLPVGRVRDLLGSLQL